MPRLLLIDNYDSFTYNLREYLGRIVGYQNIFIVKNDALSEVNPESYAGILISPGPGLPAEAGQLMSFLDVAVPTVPILGVCLGHQAIAVWSGASLKNLGEVRHGSKVMTEWTRQDPIRLGLPDRFFAACYHSWVVDETVSGSELVPLARDEQAVLMACRLGTKPVYGFQFHPESILTEYGFSLLENFVQIAKSGRD